MPKSSAKRVAIAGASGFVGQAITRVLVQDHEVIGLTRSPAVGREQAEITWRTCDLFSLRELEDALEGADVAIYLVHSMLPTARLSQGSFADLDLLLADNFSRAAQTKGVQHILYVGGLVPEGPHRSQHLDSRYEVEKTLASRVPRFTAIRSGIIIGRGSSSLWILVNLVRRLPVMVLPRWTRSLSQPISIDDLSRAVLRCLDQPDEHQGAFDVGGPDILSYRSLMERVASVLGLKRTLIGVNALSPRFSRLWVRLFGSAPDALVGPLIESLQHDMRTRDNSLQRWLEPDCQSVEEALRASLDDRDRPSPPPSSIHQTASVRSRLRRTRTVRSVQRLPLPAGRDAAWAADEYMRFLPRFIHPFIRVTTRDREHIDFQLAGLQKPLLELELASERSSPDRRVFDVTGGLLVRSGVERLGRLEFRVADDGRALLAAIHDFPPALPWYVYNLTQAIAHLQVMRKFGAHLMSTEAVAPQPPEASDDESPTNARGNATFARTTQPPVDAPPEPPRAD